MPPTSWRTWTASPARVYDAARRDAATWGRRGENRPSLAAPRAASTVPAWAQAKSSRGRGPALLTVTGAGVKANRGPFDPVRDQMMAKQKISFERAHAFDYAALAALPARTIQPTLEYDNKPHKLSGPLLRDVLKAAGVSTQTGRLQMRAVDGYAPTIAIADAAKQGFIVATHLDGQAITPELIEQTPDAASIRP